MNSQRILITILGLFVTPLSWAQSNTKDEVRFFEHFFNDAAVVNSKHLEVGARYADYDKRSGFLIGAQGGMPVFEKLDIGMRLGLLNSDPDRGDSESGITDIDLWGRYHLNLPFKANLTVGGMLTLPVGDEDVGEGDFDFGAFAAARMPLDKGFVIMGSVGLNFVERSGCSTRVSVTGAPNFEEPSFAEVGVWCEPDGKDRELSMHLGGGGIFELSPETHLIGEVGIDTEEDFFALTGGVDHALSANSRLRAALDIGLDDGAPDVGLRGGFMVGF